ncbi:MAG: hypothetical protein A4E61_00238 [Syntrophorhabdus sp. PtaB.Bin184]|nr:MAG: hypothetical protein A4E61_00238 [Syntrophorhabdus sp. PtaB.Bin184]
MSMKQVLHITSGDIAGDLLRKSGIAGEVFVWHDVLYDGPRNQGWPDEATLHARAQFLEDATGGGLGRNEILETLKAQYAKLGRAGDYDGVVLWFDACLFDQSMLCHVLACMKAKSIEKAALICVSAFPGIEPFDGLGQLSSPQLASLYDQRRPVTDKQFVFAEYVDRAFAMQDKAVFGELSWQQDAPLPWVPAAVARWLQEQPDEQTGLGRLEQLAMEAVRSGLSTPSEIFSFAAAHDTHPQFWGDITLWAEINKLATRRPPLVRIEGPGNLLPQWNNQQILGAIRVYPV